MQAGWGGSRTPRGSCEPTPAPLAMQHAKRTCECVRRHMQQAGRVGRRQPHDHRVHLPRPLDERRLPCCHLTGGGVKRARRQRAQQRIHPHLRSTGARGGAMQQQRRCCMHVARGTPHASRAACIPGLTWTATVGLPVATRVVAAAQPRRSSAGRSYCPPCMLPTGGIAASRSRPPPCSAAASRMHCVVFASAASTAAPEAASAVTAPLPGATARMTGTACCC